jgi:hypothetical protein
MKNERKINKLKSVLEQIESAKSRCILLMDDEIVPEYSIDILSLDNTIATIQCHIMDLMDAG